MINGNNQILSDFCWPNQNLQIISKWQQFITQMEAFLVPKHPQSVLQLQNISENDSHTGKNQVQSQEMTSLKSIQKQKKIMRKPESILKKLRIQNPLSFTHVHNIFNMMGINESALKDNTYEQSYFKTMFYINTVQRVELRKHALIIQLKPAQKSLQPIPYLIDRYKSFGDRKFYELATAIQKVNAKLTGQNFMKNLKKSFDGEPLSRFIDSMEGQTYMCKVAPNKLVISRNLLQLLGEDPDNYAVEICKYKMPLREIISSEIYGEIMKKSIQNIGLVCDFINATINAEHLHANTSLDFTDYLINRQNKKIYCNLILFMPTPQMSCIQVRQVINETEEVKLRCQNFTKKKQMIERHCEDIRYNEAQTLKNIMRVPQGLLKSNIKKVAEYRDIADLTC